MTAYFFSLIFYSSQHPHELRSYRKWVAGPGSKCRKTDFRAMLLTPLLVGWMNGWTNGWTKGQTDMWTYRWKKGKSSINEWVMDMREEESSFKRNLWLRVHAQPIKSTVTFPSASAVLLSEVSIPCQKRKCTHKPFYSSNVWIKLKSRCENVPLTKL